MKIQVLLLAFIAALAVIFGGLLIVSRKHWPTRVQETLLALGAGFILSLVFLKLVPVSFGYMGESAAIWILAGFATIHFFEHTIVGHLHFGEETHHDVMISRTTGYSAFAGLCIHAFFDGLSISVGLQYDFLDSRKSAHPGIPLLHPKDADPRTNLGVNDSCNNQGNMSSL